MTIIYEFLSQRMHRLKEDTATYILTWSIHHDLSIPTSLYPFYLTRTIKPVSSSTVPQIF